MRRGVRGRHDGKPGWGPVLGLFLVWLGGCGASAGSSPAAASAAGQTRSVASTAPAGSAPAASLARPARSHIMAVFDMPSGNSLGTLPQIFDFFLPGASSQLTPQNLVQVMASAALQQPSIEGLDMDRPLRLVLLDPRTFSTPVVIVGAVVDPEPLDELTGDVTTLYEGDHVMIGNAEALSALSGDERDFLTWLPTLEEPELIIFVRELATAYRAELMEVQREMVTAMLDDDDPDGDGDGDGAGESAEDRDEATRREAVAIRLAARLMGLISDCDRLVLRGRMIAGVGRLEAEVSLIQDTTMARFARAQSPADHGILALMPRRDAGDPAGMIMSGTLTSGPLRDWWLTLLGRDTRVSSPRSADRDSGTSPANPGVQATEAHRILTRWNAQLTGAFAYATSRDPDSGGSTMWLMGADDGAMAMGQIRKFEQFEPSSGVTYRHGAARHDGVIIDLKAPAGAAGSAARPGNGKANQDRTAFAGFDRYYVTVAGTHAVQGMKQAIDTLRGKSPRWSPAEPVRAALARSRARRDSLFVFLDNRFLAKRFEPLNLSARAAFVGLAFDPGSMTLTIELSP